MKNVTIVFDKTMKMSELIDADYRLLMLLERVGISLGFGDKSVETLCQQHKFDPDCFIFLANLQSNRSITDVFAEFSQLPLKPFLSYLKRSHAYFLDFRLVNIRANLCKLFIDGEEELQQMVLDFFDNYVSEVREHMKYEDEEVFPYVNTLLNKSVDKLYSIDVFEERHNDIERTMSDLKRILMKYIVGNKNQHLMTNILFELYMSEEELNAHTFIEDHLVIPRVKAMEKSLQIQGNQCK